ncbi:MAG TPA: radical SAM protein [Methanocorpusculum sp.]|nr:radical SAM protein [Methanocorpusculum sp.]
MDVDVDNHKLIYHPNRVAEWMNTGDCYPIYVEIGVTNRCNHHCVFCALDWCEHQSADIDTKLIKKALADMAKCGVKSVMFAGEGEPLMHKDICEIIEYAKKCGLDIALSTNGVLLDSEKCDKILPCLSWIRFSVDSGSPEMHKVIHRGGSKDYDKVKLNIRYAVSLKHKRNLSAVIGVQFLLIPDNLSGVIPFIETFKEIGADNVQIKPYSQHPLSENRFVIDYSEYKFLEDVVYKYAADDFQVILRTKTAERLTKDREYDKCYGLPFFSLIEADGSIVPCNLFHQTPEFNYGNLYQNSFSEIWQSETRKKVLVKLAEMGVENCRHGCRLDAINRYLYQLKNPHPHVNFI